MSTQLIFKFCPFLQLMKVVSADESAPERDMVYGRSADHIARVLHVPSLYRFQTTYSARNNRRHLNSELRHGLFSQARCCTTSMMIPNRTTRLDQRALTSRSK